MAIQDGEVVLGKIENEFELATKARNLRIHIKEESLRHEHVFNTFEAIVRESYYNKK